MLGGKFDSLKWVIPEAPEVDLADRVFFATSPVRSALWKDALAVGFPLAGKVTKNARDQAVELLEAAAEIEHALLTEYLYAAYSIDPGGPAAAVRPIVVEIAIEEMGHLISVQNLLLTIGAEPYVDRESIPLDGKPAGQYPFPIKFEPFSGDSLAKYVTTESMPLENINDPELKKELEPIFDRGRQAAGGAINHVGLLYAKIFWLFQADDSPNPYWPGMPADLLPNEWHITDKQLAKGILDQRQVTAAEFGRVPVSLVHPAADAVYVVEIRSRNDALFALAQIARQGEGYQPGDNSHFERFLKAYKDFAAILPSGVIPVPENPTTDDTALPPPAEANRITHPKACRWAKLFDVRYQLLLLELWLGVSTDRTEPGPFARGKLLKAALIEMKTRIRQIGGKLLPSLDRKDVDPKNLKAGAPFFLPDKSLPRTQKAVQARMKKLLSDAEALAVAIENLPDLNAPSADESLILKTMRRADKPFNDALAGL